MINPRPQSRPLNPAEGGRAPFGWARWLLPFVGMLSLVQCNEARVSDRFRLQVELRLYDLNRGRCLIFKPSAPGRNSNQGFITCQSPDGEAFAGEWVKVKSTKDSQTEGAFANSTLPTGGTYANYSEDWSWAKTYGVDLHDSNSTMATFIASGSMDTVINGVFAITAGSSLGVQGVAVDNRGHKYKAIGTAERSDR